MRGSAWIFFGFGSGQFIRLAGNIVVTRLLAPEIFGVMALVWVMMFALEMLSDLGAGPAIVRHKRGEDPVFLNTAWTMQVGRGFCLATVAALLAWPMARLFDEPLLLQIIPVVGLTAVVDGFGTMKSHTATRHLALGRQTLIILVSQFVGVAVMLTGALLFASIWALVAGTFATRVSRMVLAQILLPGVTNWFHWDKGAARELIGFGRWIMASSVLALISKQADKPVIALLDSMAVLGIYDRANRLSEPFNALNMQVSRKVAMPAMSKVHRDRPQGMQRTYYRARFALDAAFLPLLSALAVCAPIVVTILYDERYTAAGWMLQLLIIRAAFHCVVEPGRECLVAANRPEYALWMTIGRTLGVVVGLPIGWYLAGLPGLIIAMTLSEIPALLVIWHGMIRYNLFSVLRELRAAAFVVAGAFIGWCVTLLWDAFLAAQWQAIEAWLRTLITGGT